MQGNEFDAFNAEMLANKIGLWIAQRSQGEKSCLKEEQTRMGAIKIIVMGVGKFYLLDSASKLLIAYSPCFRSLIPPFPNACCLGFPNNSS